MASAEVRPSPPDPLLRLGPVRRLRVQVGYRVHPDEAAEDQFLLDLPLPEVDGRVADAFDEQRIFAALDPVVRVGGEASRHYSLHVHRWHTTWGPTAGAFEIGVTVTTGPRTAAGASYDAVVEAFGTLMAMTDPLPDEALSRDAAATRAPGSVAAAYGVDAETLVLTSEEHHRDRGAWGFGLRTPTLDRYAVLVGLIDGYAGSVRVQHAPAAEARDSVGTD